MRCSYLDFILRGLYLRGVAYRPLEYDINSEEDIFGPYLDLLLAWRIGMRRVCFDSMDFNSRLR